MEFTGEDVKDWLERHVYKTFYVGNEEFPFLLSILERHPNYDNWKYKEITGFRITRSVQKKSVQVEIRVVCKNKEKWRLVSWKSCISGQKKVYTDKSKLNSAMRYAIRRQIAMYRKNNPNKKCAICKSTTKIEVDHDVNHKSFKMIRDEFIEKYPEVPSEFTYAKYNFRFKKSDDTYKKKWQMYHNKHAQYRYLCETCNKIYKS